MAWPTRLVYPLPDSLTPADGAMLEPLGVALHAVDLARLRTGMTVGVYGCGPIGLLVLQAARLAGATRIIATDRLPHRVRAARALGAEVAFLSRGGDENPGILTAAGGRGVDVAFECAGENDAVETAVETTGRGGAVLLAGIPAGDRIAFTASSARRKGLTLKLVRRMKHTYPRAIDLAARGLVDVRSLVTDTLPLDAYAEAFATARRREGVKVMIGEE